MNDPASQSSKTAPLLHLFNQNRASTVRFEDDVLTVWAKSGRIAQSVNIDEIREVKLQKLPLVTRLTVLTKQGRTVTVSGLERSTSERLHSQVKSRVEEMLNDKAARKATTLGPRITDLRDSITVNAGIENATQPRKREQELTHDRLEHLPRSRKHPRQAQRRLALHQDQGPRRNHLRKPCHGSHSGGIVVYPGHHEQQADLGVGAHILQRVHLVLARAVGNQQRLIVRRNHEPRRVTLRQ